MLTEGLILMVIGMSVVFVFLIVMVLAMNIMAALMKPLAKLIPEPQEKQVVKVRKPAGDDLEEIAVAIAAVNSFTK
jgi:oxaloacetate decarboxylase gamma subunit